MCFFKHHFRFSHHSWCTILYSLNVIHMKFVFQRVKTNYCGVWHTSTCSGRELYFWRVSWRSNIDSLQTVSRDKWETCCRRCWRSCSVCLCLPAHWLHMSCCLKADKGPEACKVTTVKQVHIQTKCQNASVLDMWGKWGCIYIVIGLLQHTWAQKCKVLDIVFTCILLCQCKLQEQTSDYTTICAN
jgi:hypothetical protein